MDKVLRSEDKDLRLKGKDKDLWSVDWTLVQSTDLSTRTCKLVLEDKDFP